jgi:hypothetical protein
MSEASGGLQNLLLTSCPCLMLMVCGFRPPSRGLGSSVRLDANITMFMERMSKNTVFVCSVIDRFP